MGNCATCCGKQDSNEIQTNLQARSGILFEVINIIGNDTKTLKQFDDVQNANNGQ